MSKSLRPALHFRLQEFRTLAISLGCIVAAVAFVKEASAGRNLDVWGYETVNAQVSYLCKSEAGDYYIFSSVGSGNTKIGGFFSGLRLELPQVQAEAIARGRTPLRGVGLLGCAEPYKYKKAIILKDGYTVARTCVGESCQQPFHIGLQVRDKNQNIVANKVFLYLSDSPGKVRIRRPASEGGSFFVVGRVHEVTPFLAPLDDETFLVIAGDVIRFDTQLNTIFPINRRHLFVLNSSSIEEIYRDASARADGNALTLYQTVENKLADLLSKIKKGEGQ